MSSFVLNDKLMLSEKKLQKFTSSKFKHEYTYTSLSDYFVHYPILTGNSLKSLGTRVNVYALHPGVIDTELGRHLEDTYPWVATFVTPLVRLFIKTPIQGAQTTLYCSLDENCANETGLYYA